MLLQIYDLYESGNEIRLGLLNFSFQNENPLSFFSFVNICSIYEIFRLCLKYVFIIRAIWDVFLSFISSCKAIWVESEPNSLINLTSCAHLRKSIEGQNDYLQRPLHW